MHNIIRLIYLGYFFTHIPITILLDLQGLLPSSIYDALGVSNFFIWYHTAFDDHLMGTPPIWLKSFLFSEMVFQLPFFFVAVDALRKKKCSDLVKTLFIVYGTHTATTVLPILADFIAASKYLLVAIYFPYFAIPLSLVFYFGLRKDPFCIEEGIKKAN